MWALDMVPSMMLPSGLPLDLPFFVGLLSLFLGWKWGLGFLGLKLGFGLPSIFANAEVAAQTISSTMKMESGPFWAFLESLLFKAHVHSNSVKGIGWEVGVHNITELDKMPAFIANPYFLIGATIAQTLPTAVYWRWWSKKKLLRRLRLVHK